MVKVTETIKAEMFEGWPQKPKTTEVANDFFRYREDAKGEGRRVEFSFAYELLTDRVPVADLAKYNAALTKLKETLGYTFTYNTADQLAALRKNDRFNWSIAAFWGAVMLVATAAGIFFVRASRLAAPLPPPIDAPALSGIGGWLILVAIYQTMRPFVFLWGGLALYPTIFNLETWRQLTEAGGSAYHQFWAPALLFELFYNSLAFVFSVFLLVLFFKKRAAWPLAYAIFLVFLVAGVALDVYLTQKIPAAAAGTSTVSAEVIRVAVAAAVWIPYCFVSKRVKSTFRY